VNNNNSIVVTMLGAIIVLLLALLVNQIPMTPSAHAQTSTASGDLMMVAATTSSGPALWVIKKGENGEQLALYRSDSGGRTVTFAASRKIAYDLKLIEYNDRSQHKVKDLKKKLEEYNKKNK
jgi:hypothetical protein